MQGPCGLENAMRPESPVPHPTETALSDVAGGDAMGPHQLAPFPPLRARTLGIFAVWRGNCPVPPAALTQRKASLLLKALLAAPGHRLHREQLLNTLWPDTEPDQGAQRLRSTLYRLRGALGAAYLPSPGDLLVLDPAPGGGTPPPDWLDAAAFERAATVALANPDLERARAALARYTGDYLPEEDAAPFAARRATLRTLAHALTVHTASLAPPAEAARLLSALLREEPTHEEAALALIRLLAEQGRPADALRVYDGLAVALAAELGLDPGPPLRALRDHLLALAAAPAAAPVVPSAPTTSVEPLPDTLPTPLTPFVGRAAALDALGKLLAGARLLTLTGPGGVGKTRLGLELARRARPLYPDGVAFVDLVPLDDDALVVPAVAGALGVREERDVPLVHTLVQALRARHLLLVLDNAEHLVSACAALAAALLESCPELRVLATSREALGVAGEARYHVPSLDLPESDDPKAVAASEAAQLFAARAAAPNFALDVAAAPLVAAVCRQLDGIPLALELAAARLNVLALPQLVERLDDRFRLLTTGSRTVLPRHQTLRATMDWSYGLLRPPEQALLRRLSVFSGGCTLDAAEVVGGDGIIARDDVLDVLTGLSAKSLVLVEQQRTMARYRLLEIVRAYAAEALAADGEAREARRCHAGWVRDMVEAAEAELTGPDQEEWFARLDRDYDNVRAALRWARADGTPKAVELGLGIVGAFGRFWYMRGQLREGRAWLEELLSLDAATSVSAAVRAKAFNAAGTLAWTQGDYAGATAWHEAALALRRALCDRASIAVSLNNLGLVAWNRGDHARAHTLFEEALALHRDLGNTWGLASTLNNLGAVAHDQGDHRRAATLHEQALDLHQALDDMWGVAASLDNLGLAARDQGDDRRAVALVERALEIHRTLDDTRGIAYSLNNLGLTLLSGGDDRRALAAYREGLTLFQRIGDARSVAEALEGIAALFARQEHHRRAARLLAAADALRARIGARLPPTDQGLYNETLALLRARLEAHTFDAAWVDGRGLALEDAVAVAMADDSAEDRSMRG